MVLPEDYTSYPNKRQVAKLLGISHYFTGKPCKHSHLCLRRTTDGNCLECNRVVRRQKYAKNPERYKEKYHQYYQDHKEAISKVKNQYYQENKHDWYLINKAKRAKMYPTSLYKLHKEAIKAIYVECRRRCKSEGSVYEVDHIYPIEHPDFCGLHVPWNMQIIPVEENRKKFNKRPEEFYKDFTSPPYGFPKLPSRHSPTWGQEQCSAEVC